MLARFSGERLAMYGIGRNMLAPTIFTDDFIKNSNDKLLQRRRGGVVNDGILAALEDEADVKRRD